MSKTFDFYGDKEGTEGFEDKLIFSLVFDNRFLDDVVQIIDPTFFNGLHRRWIVKHVIEQYNKNSKSITYQTVLISLKRDNYFSVEEKKGELTKIIKLAKSFSDEDYVTKMLSDKEEIQEATKDFCKTKKYVNAIQECAKLVGTVEENEIPNIMSKTEMMVDPTHVGTDFFDIEDRKNTSARVDVIPTPWKALNDHIGGVGKEELITWVAGMGSGKSTFGSNLALHAMSLGYNVVLYTLELGEKYNRARIDSVMTKINSDNLKDNLDVVEKKIEELKKNGGSLTIKKFGTGITAHTIINHFNRLKARGKSPDLYILDYIDLMDSIEKSNNKKTDWEKFGEVTKEIRNEISFKQKVAGHAFLQGNTSAIKDFVISAESSSGGARRLFPADVVLGVARPPDLKAMEILNLSVIKNRFGKDGFYLRGETDYSIGHIELKDQMYFNMMEDETLHTKNSIKDDYKKYKKIRTQASTRVQKESDFSI